MVDQTTMNGRPEPPAAREVGRNLGDFLHDICSLAELQWELLKLDLREGGTRCILPAAFIAGALLLALASVPLLMFAIAWLLVVRANLSQDVAFLITGMFGIGVAGGLAWLGLWKLRAAARTFTRSQHELQENVRWIKHALKKCRPASPETHAFNR